MIAFSITLNGVRKEIVVDVRDTLLNVLRERLGLTSIREGCETVQCGSCTVNVDGQAVKACSMLAVQAEGKQITTVEGLPGPEAKDSLQYSFKAEHAVQCGYCTPGMLMNASEYLAEKGSFAYSKIRKRLRGNLCRCTGYQNIVDAISRSTDSKRASKNTESNLLKGQQRTEDKRLLLGKGQFTDDMLLPGQLHAKFLRSAVANASIRDIDTSDAKRIEGVIAVYTAKDISQDGLKSPVCSWQVTDADGTPMRANSRPLLASEDVKYVGQPIVMVVAKNLRIAEEAVQRIKINYRRSAPVIDPRLAPQASAIHKNAADNKAFQWEMGDRLQVQDALNRASHVSTVKLQNNRVIAAPMETRAANGEYDEALEQFTLHVTTQNPHIVRRVIAEEVGLAPEHKINVVSQDVGGSFGSKIFVYGEECLCLWASRKLGAPVKWKAGRTEAFSCDIHGRDHYTEASLALNKEGLITAIDVRTIANLGAYLSPFGSLVPTFNYAMMLIGPYTTPAFFCKVTGVYTNTSPVDAYRGAGRPEATFLLETLIDKAAIELGRDPADLRFQNLIPPHRIPYQPPNGLVYDSGDYPAHFIQAIERSNYADFETRRRISERHGKKRGIGICNYLEACGIGPSAISSVLGAEYGLWEAATLRFSPTAKLEVLIGSHAQGQGHETTFAQLTSEILGIPFDDISIVHGDTRRVPMGMGTYGSRSLVVGGSAIVMAARKLIDKGKLIAAHKLDCEKSSVIFEGPFFGCEESNKKVSLVEIVLSAYAPHDYPEDLEPGMEATAFYDPENFTYPSGTHVCEVEVDSETGIVEVVAYTAVDDFGTVVNGSVVDGQLHGGIAQGIGQALWEEIVYDPETGELLTDSFREYAVPKAEILPTFDLSRTMTACTHNPLGAKGCGESGAIAAPPAVINAVNSAIGSWVSMPATPEKVWKAMQENEEAS